MRTLRIPGFPPHGPRLDLPNIAELLMQPMFYMIDADALMKHGTDFQRSLLTRAPLANDRKYVTVAIKVNMFYPARAATSKTAGFERMWHRDGLEAEGSRKSDLHHLLLSECEVTTEFNTRKSTLRVADDYSLSDLLEDVNSGKIPVEGRLMDANRFVTFENHIHRPTDTRATHHQFRYSYRIIESDYHRPRPMTKSRQTKTQVLPPHSADHRLYTTNVERTADGDVILYRARKHFRRIH